MAQARRASTQSVRQKSISIMSIDKDILRGVSLRKTLRGFGKYWRISPVDLRSEERAALWNNSREVERIDAFLSQSWTEPGWQKYLSLQMLFHWKIPVLVQALATIIFSVMDINGFMPTSEYTSRKYFEEEVTRPVSLWSPIPALLGYASLCLVPEIGKWPQKPDVFFDAMCINQADEATKLRGIYSLTGFLANSEKLVVLWSPSYFTRCWCVCEAAAFTSLNGAKSVRWCPLFVQCWTVLVHATLTAWGTLDVALYLAGSSLMLRQTIVYLCMAIPTFIGVRFGRNFVKDKQKLRRQLEEWDFSQAQCREDSDRELVRTSIQHWFGDMSAFEGFVRGELKENAVRSLDGFKVSPENLMFVVSGSMGFFAQWVIAFARSGLSLEGVLAWTAGLWTEVVCVIPLQVAIVMAACELVNKPLKGKWRNELLNIVLAFLLQIFCVIFHVMVRAINDRVRFASFFNVALWSGAVICTYWPRS